MVFLKPDIGRPNGEQRWPLALNLACNFPGSSCASRPMTMSGRSLSAPDHRGSLFVMVSPFFFRDRAACRFHVTFNTALNHHGRTINVTEEDAHNFDHEAELVIVIGRQARNVTEQDAPNYIF